MPIPFSDVPTAQEQRSLYESNLSSVPDRIRERTIEILLKQTAPDRHRARVHAATESARQWLRPIIGEPSSDAEIRLLCALEVEGLYGGGWISPGAGTDRHCAFQGLGKGRRQASDGHAWTAAIKEASCGIQVSLVIQYHDDGSQFVSVKTDYGPHTPDLMVTYWDLHYLKSIFACGEIETFARQRVIHPSYAGEEIAAALLLATEEVVGPIVRRLEGDPLDR